MSNANEKRNFPKGRNFIDIWKMKLYNKRKIILGKSAESLRRKAIGPVKW